MKISEEKVRRMVMLEDEERRVESALAERPCGSSIVSTLVWCGGGIELGEGRKEGATYRFKLNDESLGFDSGRCGIGSSRWPSRVGFCPRHGTMIC